VDIRTDWGARRPRWANLLHDGSWMVKEDWFIGLEQVEWFSITVHWKG